MDVHSAPVVTPLQKGTMARCMNCMVRDFPHPSQWVWGSVVSFSLYELGLGRISAANGFCAVTLHVLLVITGSIARSANLPVFSLLRGRF